MFISHHVRSFACAVALFGGLLGATPMAAAIELTFDLSNYAYRETDDEGRFFIEDNSESVFYSLGIRNWDRPEANDEFGFMYTGEATYGQVNYKSVSTGTMDKRYYKGRVEAYGAYRFDDNVTAIAGLGYRHLRDDSGGKFTNTGNWYYTRRSQYFYMPLGARFDPMDDLYIKAQYNLFLLGNQTSYLNSAQPAYPDVMNEQHDGWGLDIAGNYEFATDWSVYGFYRYWSVEKSEIANGNTQLGYVTWFEPDNTTNEFGLGIAYRF